MNHQASETQIELVATYVRKGLYLAAIVLVGGLGYLAYNHYQESLASRAFDALFAAEKIERQAESDGNSLSSPEKEIQYAQWPDARRAEYIKALESVRVEFRGTTAAAMAGLKLGRFYYSTQMGAESETAYQWVLSNYKSASAEDKNLTRAMALEGLGVLYESRGDFLSAEKTFREATSLISNPLRPLALLGLARSLREQKKFTEASQQYESLIKEFPNSDYEKRARALRALMPAEGDAQG